ncbi:MAG: phosphoglycerate kinase [Candidatus Woesearchaeota archaeon]
MKVPSLSEIPVSGRYVMVRAGLDVPFDLKKDLLDPARVSDDTRIRDIIPTLGYLIDSNAKIILAAGWAGKPTGVDPDYSMAPVAKRLEQILEEKKLLRYNVLIAPDCYNDKTPKSVYKNQEEVRRIVSSLKNGQVVVLENVRFDPEAKVDDPKFAAFFASLADLYVNENETQNHRNEPTIVITPILMAEQGKQVVYGFHYLDVLETIGKLKQKIENPERGPFVLGLCGKKIETGPGVISKVTIAYDLMDGMKKGDTVIAGAAVVYSFLLAEHYSSLIQRNIGKVNEVVAGYDGRIVAQTRGQDAEKSTSITSELQKQKSNELKKLLGIDDGQIKQLIGDSYITPGQEGEQIISAYNFLAKANSLGIRVFTAVDHTIADKKPDKSGNLPADANIRAYGRPTGIPAGWLGVSEGPNTLEQISGIIQKAEIYLQSGPYSIEDRRVEEFSGADRITFKAASVCKSNGGLTIGAGGDTTARIHVCGAEGSFSVMSGAGGATLELITSGTSKGKEAVEAAQKMPAKP